MEAAAISCFGFSTRRHARAKSGPYRALICVPGVVYYSLLYEYIIYPHLNVPATLRMQQPYMIASQLDALSGLELGPQLRQLDVRLGVGLEEILLAVPELLGEGLETLVVEEGLVTGQLEQLGVGRCVGDGGKVAVIELQPLLGPARTARFVVGSLAVSALLLAAVRELGLLGAEARAVLVGAAECVRAREGHNFLGNLHGSAR